MITIKHKKDTWPPHEGSYKDTIVIYDDDWDDFSYKTLMHMCYCDSNGKVHEIGDIKIYFCEFDEPDTVKNRKPSHSFVKDQIEQFDTNACSLGQNMAYYSNLKKYFPSEFYDILKRLRDIALFEDIRSEFVKYKGVAKSLLRDGSAEKAMHQAFEVLNNMEVSPKDISFEYKAKIKYSDSSSSIKFDFRKNECLPYRINILIGKNGTGKTQILRNLADDLSGFKGLNHSGFTSQRPLIDKVISISYSAFDAFRKRPEREQIGKKEEKEREDNQGDDEVYYLNHSYVYCGIQSQKGTLSLEALDNTFKNSYDLIEKKKRVGIWNSIMQELLGPVGDEIIDIIRNHSDNHSVLSSGQHIMACSITEALANIENESIILFDEPEIHLHPNAVASVMRMIYKMLDEFNSYAIFATHSPLIVQETPSRYIHILERIDNKLIIRKPERECFGENISNIIQDIFNVSPTESNYKSVLKKLSQDHTYEEVLDIFDQRLGFGAMLYLKSCYKDPES